MSLQNAAIGRLSHVEGVVNYFKRMAEYRFDPPPRELHSNVAYEPHCVIIRDMRPVAEHMSLDREGFALVTHPSAVKDFCDEDELRDVYYPEAEHLVASVTGASRVIVFDHTIRRRIPLSRGRVGLQQHQNIEVDGATLE
jgi:hypothetical protein